MTVLQQMEAERSQNRERLRLEMRRELAADCEPPQWCADFGRKVRAEQGWDSGTASELKH